MRAFLWAAMFHLEEERANAIEQVRSIRIVRACLENFIRQFRSSIFYVIIVIFDFNHFYMLLTLPMHPAHDHH
jgi:hypothetical protein